MAIWRATQLLWPTYNRLADLTSCSTDTRESVEPVGPFAAEDFAAEDEGQPKQPPPQALARWRITDATRVNR